MGATENRQGEAAPVALCDPIGDDIGLSYRALKGAETAVLQPWRRL